MARYRIHIPLQDFEGAKTERTYTCTREATFEAPQGEFKTLTPGIEYSRIDAGGAKPKEKENEEEQSQGKPQKPEPPPNRETRQDKGPDERTAVQPSDSNTT
jgi:hypothetical protein